jgi:carboxypeptidase family protein
MHRTSDLLLLLSACVITGLCSVTAAAQSVHGSIRGGVSDSSGAVLPGVTVVALAGNGEILATAVTNETGDYSLTSLPPGPTRVTFELEGFATSVVALIVQAGVESHVSRRLALAAIAERVDVIGRSPIEPPTPVPPRPAPVIVPVAEHDHESVCGPAKSDGFTPSLGTVLSRPDGNKSSYYIEGHEILIEGGTRTGLEVGRNLAVRRTFRVRGAAGVMTGDHTSGVVQITSVGERVSHAVVVYACDEITRGDFLASFSPEPLRTPEPAGIPAYWDASRILFADIGQILGTPRRLMVIDRGATSGLRVSQRLTVFRQTEADADAPLVIGDAVVVAVRGESATIRILNAIDVVSFGDWAAPQRYAETPSSLTAADALDSVPR